MKRLNHILCMLTLVFVHGTSRADSIYSIPQVHDFQRGKNLVQRHFKDVWNGIAHSVYQSGQCTGGNSLREHNGFQDQKPVEITKLMLLGKADNAPFYPVYLVSGQRTIWIAPTSTFVSLPCTWLVSFTGNEVRRVREASDLSYLFEVKE